MNDGSGLILPPGLRESIQRASKQNRKSRRSQKKLGRFDGKTVSGIVVPDPLPSKEHYHIIYHSVKDEVSMPGYSLVFLTAQECWQRIAEMGNEAEPNVEWYGEDGKIGLEVRMPGRTGLWWMILEAAGCTRSTCQPDLSREKLKRALVVMPGKKK